MFIWQQQRGLMTHSDSGDVADSEVFAWGYSGFGDGKNNPSMQDQQGIGPLPCGFYIMEVITSADGEQLDYENKKAPVIKLYPYKENQMFGREGFLIHGDSISAPGTASHGCVIENHSDRVRLAQAIELGDNILKVTP